MDIILQEKLQKLTSVAEGNLGVFCKGFFGGVTQVITGLSNSLVLEKGVIFQQLYSYVSVYASFGVMTSFIGVLVIVFSFPIKKMMGKIH